MGISQKALLALVVGCFMSAGAQAAVSYGDGQPYVGAKIGQFMIDDGDSNDSFDDATAFGVYAGYNFTPQFGMEVEYVGSSEESESVNFVESGYAGYAERDYDYKTYGIYGTYRYAFPNTALYAKGKLGFAKAEIDESVSVTIPGVGSESYSESYSDSGIAGGIGLGYLVNPNIAIEAEYALIAEDLDLLTIGANFKF